MWFQERRETDGSHSEMTFTIWYQQRVDGDHIVVSGENIWQSLCGFNREWMVITMWYQERTDGSHNVVSTESGRQSQCGVKRKQITISV